MLTQLSIRNVAVIKSLDVDIKNGVNVLTGETGAGKSIIIDSINMILGERTSKDIVRYGEEYAQVQAVFENLPAAVSDILNENDIETENGEIIISRKITAEGKSTARINGSVIPLSLLRTIASYLINIHGQHDNQALLNTSKHILFLDEYAKDDAELERYREIHKKTKEIKKELDGLNTDEETKKRRTELLEYQIREITAADVKIGETEELLKTRTVCENAEKISTALNAACDNLYDGENAQSAYDAISAATDALGAVTDCDSVLQNAYDALSAAMYTIEDVSHELKEFSGGIDFDEQTLNDIEERLDVLSKLKKYGNTEGEILEYLKKAEAELDAVEAGDERKAELEKEYLAAKDELLSAGSALSDVRRKNAEVLGNEITQSLHELNMENAKLSIKVDKGAEFYENGMDTVEFMIRTNPGEPLKPFAKIASGGELSRVILAIKSIFADGVDTMIFDEIDTGVSGAAALKITQKLVKIGKDRQVICITHLPQLAAAADTHYLIIKNTDGETASTILKELTKEERERELVRITDGGDISDAALLHAKQMLDNAQKLR